MLRGMRWLAITDTLLPGSGLIVDGRVLPGAVLLAPAVAVWTALLLCLVIGGAFAEWALPRALPVLVLLAVAALVVRWRFARQARFDPAATRALARAAAKAWLRGQDAEAATGARQLVRTAPDLAGAWRLAALVTGDARAARRADAIDARAG